MDLGKIRELPDTTLGELIENDWMEASRAGKQTDLEDPALTSLATGPSSDTGAQARASGGRGGTAWKLQRNEKVKRSGSNAAAFPSGHPEGMPSASSTSSARTPSPRPPSTYEEIVLMLDSWSAVCVSEGFRGKIEKR